MAHPPAPAPTPAGTTTPTSPISDPQRIRALAHPLRIELLDVLADEEATATRCAELTGESVASCSFHLRTLAKYGFIEPAEQRGREKPWRVLERSRRITPDWDDPASVRAAQEFASLDLEQESSRLLGWIRRAGDLPHDWVEATTMTSATLWLTRDELHELSRAISALTEPFRDRREHPDTRPEGARRAHLFAATTVDVDPPTDRPRDQTTGDQ
ncbi:MAG: ArsR family transcriptional regulator [Ilumatobacter sp.]|nr:MAG: ArsR family transcriptional regulator [Ilumatobacter sp.]